MYEVKNETYNNYTCSTVACCRVGFLQWLATKNRMTERTFANVNASNAENVKIPTVQRMYAKTNARDIPNKNLSLPYCPSTLTKDWRATTACVLVASIVLSQPIPISSECRKKALFGKSTLPKQWAKTATNT